MQTSQGREEEGETPPPRTDRGLLSEKSHSSRAGKGGRCFAAFSQSTAFIHGERVGKGLFDGWEEEAGGGSTRIRQIA